jgi:hypothetical protein
VVVIYIVVELCIVVALDEPPPITAGDGLTTAALACDVYIAVSIVTTMMTTAIIINGSSL